MNQEGGKVLCGGERVILGGELKDGYYISPAVIENLPMIAERIKKKFLVR